MWVELRTRCFLSRRVSLLSKQKAPVWKLEVREQSLTRKETETLSAVCYTDGSAWNTLTALTSAYCPFSASLSKVILVHRVKNQLFSLLLVSNAESYKHLYECNFSCRSKRPSIMCCLQSCFISFPAEVCSIKTELTGYFQSERFAAVSCGLFLLRAVFDHTGTTGGSVCVHVWWSEPMWKPKTLLNPPDVRNLAGLSRFSSFQCFWSDVLHVCVPQRRGCCSSVKDAEFEVVCLDIFNQKAS